ncbi:MAG TPA: hypothetical protein VK875_10880 [Euzebyales bacterium]|nr:hypothetical protein [Euzebyales bacterium]
MSSHQGDTHDAAILDQIHGLAERISDERTRILMHNVVGALRATPKPIPRGVLGSVLEAVALNPQPLPPSAGDVTVDVEPPPGANESTLPPEILRTVLEAVALNPQPLPPESEPSP